MKKIRIGKDIQIIWTIKVKGEEETPDLNSLNLSVEMCDHIGNKVSLPFSITEENKLQINLSGKDKRRLGVYWLTCWSNKGAAGQTAVDEVTAFELVKSTNLEGGEDSDTLSTATLELESEVVYGVPGHDAYSPYIGENGNWYAYNDETNKYEDTGVQAKGDKGDPGFTEAEKQAIIDEVQGVEKSVSEAEAKRVEAEDKRVSNEDAREKAETERQQTFVTNEQKREQTASAQREAEAKTASDQRTAEALAFSNSEAQRTETFNANEKARQQNEDQRIEAEKKREETIKKSENVNASLSGTVLTVTDRDGNQTSIDTKGEKGDPGKDAVVDTGTTTDWDNYIAPEETEQQTE